MRMGEKRKFPKGWNGHTEAIPAFGEKMGPVEGSYLAGSTVVALFAMIQ